jgi:predicted Zn-dependent protease
MYVQRGDVAFERRQYEDALALFGRAVDANPADAAGTALQRLGGTYLTLGRYAEAVPVLQRLPIRGRGMAEGYLALACVDAGHDTEAMTLLQRGGRSEAKVAAEIESLRERVRQRPIR